MTTTQNRVAGYREPWTGGAKAYPEADTPSALVEGAKRKRNTFLVHLSHDGFGDMECAVCGRKAGDPYPANEGDTELVTDRYATGKYHPRTRTLVVMHYYCSWRALMLDVFALGRRLGY